MKGEKDMEKIDYKKVYPDLYQPKQTPMRIRIPRMTFLAVDGKGDPNRKDGEYQQAMEILYGLSFTIKMSYKSHQEPEGYFQYVVPPLEGLWWGVEPEGESFFRGDKSHFQWTALIRQPDFVTPDVFCWAKETLSKKKPELPLEKARLISWEEGLCVQAMHVGPYDTEPETLKKIKDFLEEEGLREDHDAVLPDGSVRRHHELYLGDPRRTKPENLKTVLRIPVREA